MPGAFGAGVGRFPEAAGLVDFGVPADRAGSRDLVLGKGRMTSSWLMVPALVTRRDTVPCATVLRSAVMRMAPPIIPLRGPIMGPPMFVSETPTTGP